MRAVCLALVLAAAAAVGSCGGDDPEKQVASLMSELRDVQESGDAEKACEEVYVVQEPGREPESEEEEEREKEEREGGGEPGARCEPAFERALEQRKAAVKRLKTKLVRVDVEGDEGTAVLHTSATRTDGSTFERDVPYPVVHTEEGWRVRISPEG